MNFKSSQVKVILFLLSILSLGLIVVVDNVACKLLNNLAPQFLVLGQIRLLSLLICFGLYQYFKSFSLRTVDTPNWKKTFLAASIWLVSATYFVLIKKVPVLQISSWIDVIAFLITGLLAEEFLFRGCIYELAKKAYPHLYVWKNSGAIIISSLLFGLQHFAYHQFLFTSEAIIQVSGTIIMGIFFSSVREFSGRLWPVILLHFLNNALTLIRNFYP